MKAKSVVSKEEVFQTIAADEKVEVRKIRYHFTEDTCASSNSVLGSLAVADFAGKGFDTKKCWVSPGGWQSWNPSCEVEPGRKLDSLKCRAVPQWNAYLQVPGEKQSPFTDIISAQFIAYLREGNRFFVLASTGAVKNSNPLPPVCYRISRKKGTVEVFVCDKGKSWKKGDLAAEICVFTCGSWFSAKDTLGELYGKDRFASLDFLGKIPGGWESWYNRYADIDENLILEDLDALSETENLISLSYISKGKNAVFQIDDGWEKALGDWEVNEKFPNGLKSITEKIEEKNMVPGIWIAPFIADSRCPAARLHPEWLLRDKKGNPVVAGFNPLWGAKKGKDQPSKWNHSFFCWDLSNDEVLEFLDERIDIIINLWGFRYLKLDFLYAGMLYGDFAAGGSAFEWFTRAIRRLTSRKTDSAGKQVAYLGCGTPMELSFNDLPLSRIGCDTYEHWENRLLKFIGWNGRNSAYLNLKDTIAHAMWNRSVFWCDPDVIFTRRENCSLTEDEKILIASVAFMFGNQVMYSDDPAKCTSQEEIALTRRILELQEKYSAEEWSAIPLRRDLFEVASRSRNYMGYINLSDKKARIGKEVIMPHSIRMNG